MSSSPQPQSLCPERKKHSLSGIVLPAVLWSPVLEPCSAPTPHTAHSTGCSSYPTPAGGLLTHYTHMAPQTDNTETAAVLNYLCLFQSLQRAGANALNLPPEIHSSCLCCAREQRGLIMPPLPSAEAPSSCSARANPRRCLLPLRISSVPNTYTRRAGTHTRKETHGGRCATTRPTPRLVQRVAHQFPIKSHCIPPFGF